MRDKLLAALQSSNVENMRQLGKTASVKLAIESKLAKVAKIGRLIEKGSK